MSAERCAKIAVKGMIRRKAVIVPGFSMNVLRFLVKVIPYSWILPIAYRIQKQK
jgi:short-subunit dehydrogenase